MRYRAINRGEERPLAEKKPLDLRVRRPWHVPVGRVREAVEAARTSGVRTVFVRHVTMPRRLIGAAQLRMWKAWQRRESAAEVVSAFPPGADHARLAPEVEPADDEAVIDKVTMSAFEGTPLDIILRDCGVRTASAMRCCVGPLMDMERAVHETNGPQLLSVDCRAAGQ